MIKAGSKRINVKLLIQVSSIVGINTVPINYNIQCNTKPHRLWLNKQHVKEKNQRE